MKKNLKLLNSSALVALSFASLQAIRGMEDISKLEEQRTPSGIQLSKGANDTAEAERQRIRQETEQRQREVREKVALLSSRIDTTIQRVKELQNYRLTYGELVKVLDVMDEFYVELGEESTKKAWVNEITAAHGWRDYAHYHHYLCQQAAYDSNRDLLQEYAVLPPYIEALAEELIKKDINEKMDKYLRLSGAPHPRKDEFSGK